jgi:oligo-alginate lyase
MQFTTKERRHKELTTCSRLFSLCLRALVVQKGWTRLAGLTAVLWLGVSSGAGLAAMEVSPARFEHLGPHPRLFANSARWLELRTQIRADPVSERLAATVIARADRMLALPNIVYEKSGRRLLRPVREGLSRILALSMAARLTDGAHYRERAIAEMRRAAALPDWNPSHFLDTAEMTFALAVGYDWLFEWIPPEDRAILEQAIVEKGLMASFPDGPPPGWINANNNWTQVCHAGLVAGAIATGAQNPELSVRVLQRALEHLPGSARFAYAPDGAYPEGPSYWAYGTTYHVILADMLQHALGTTLGTDAYPGFLETARYLDRMTGPSGAFFNYADGGEQRGFSPALFWFARRLDDGSILRTDLGKLDAMLQQITSGGDEQSARFSPLALLWWDPALEQAARNGASTMPLSWLGRGKTPVAVHRSAWDDRRALFVGLKAGPINASHAHMDLGSFVVEALGVRWAVDPGWQDYTGLEARGLDLWSYRQDADRWKVFRLGSEAHNILRFNGRPQDVAANVPIAAFSDAPPHQHAAVDLSSAYPGVVSDVRRSVGIEDGERIRIEDTWIAGDEPVETAWQWLTRAEAAVIEGGVVLKEAGEMLVLRVIAPAAGWSVTVEETDHLLRPHDEPNPGLRRVVLHTRTEARAPGRIVVIAEPATAAQP